MVVSVIDVDGIREGVECKGRGRHGLFGHAKLSWF